ncbi:hypothetical protein [Streptomyces sp. NPDC058326]|uniref:hypothetical protein n=1 Tax=Streptomyces sp. NPDC058326 TaxID=3346447 RepID=UPI0036EA1A27
MCKGPGSTGDDLGDLSPPPRHDRPPAITLRDLRLVSATLTHGAGDDIHTIEETLRHSTITLTSGTYTSLLPEVDRAEVEAAAALLPWTGRVQAPPELS